MFFNKNILFFVLALILSSHSISQNQQIPLHTFFKQQSLKFSSNNSIETYYPIYENQLNLTDSLKDNKVFYYDLFVWLVKKNWVDIVTPEGKLSINPLINLSLGSAKSGSIKSNLYRNTRGVSMSGELYKKTSFSFVFCENQALFQSYETNFFNDRGELYDFGNYYSKQNAVIPSGARTKPFKVNGYDYAFSFGNVAYQPSKKIRIELGNNQQFVGNGYRSILLSDNAISAPKLRLSYYISPKISYHISYARNLNLIRKPITKAVESSYEKKLFSVNYLTFKPIKQLAISLFSAANQLISDSLIKHKIVPQSLVPIALINSDLVLKSDIINGIAGLNIDIALNKKRIYGQVAIDNFNSKQLTAYQLGFYWFDFLRIKNFNIQFEYNTIPEFFYESDNLKLSYSQANIALAHPKGNNFSEIYSNLNYEFKRFYASNSFLVYFSKGSTVNAQINANSIFKELKTNNELVTNGNTIINTFELGYRINRKYNPTLFIQMQGRATNYGDVKLTNTMYLGGIRVNLFNQYLDF